MPSTSEMDPVKSMKNANGSMKKLTAIMTSGAELWNESLSTGTNDRTALPDKGPMKAPQYIAKRLRSATSR